MNSSTFFSAVRFFSRKVLTTKGIRQAFVLAFLNVKTRRVILSPATYKPDAEWIATQAESFVEQARIDCLPVARLIRDHDGAFSKVFDEVLRRGIARDQQWMTSPEAAEHRYRTKYIPGEQLYVNQIQPHLRAQIVLKPGPNQPDSHHPAALTRPDPPDSERRRQGAGGCWRARWVAALTRLWH